MIKPVEKYNLYELIDEYHCSRVSIEDFTKYAKLIIKRFHPNLTEQELYTKVENIIKREL